MDGDIAITWAWCNATINGVVSVDQTSHGFKLEVCDKYIDKITQKYPKLVEKRKHKEVGTRWGVIQAQLNKYLAHYESQRNKG